MSKVTTATEPSDGDKSTTVTRLADTQKSDAHVAQLLNIADACSKMLWTRTEIGEVVDIDPVVTAQCRKTYELVHLRLRGLVDEERRWSLDPTASERESSKLIDSTLELYNQKTINAKLHNKPSIFLRPKIGRFDAGWIVWVGGDVPTKRDLHGVGESPAVAMKNFDDCYYQLESIANAQPPAPAPAPAPAPVQKRASRKKKNT